MDKKTIGIALSMLTGGLAAGRLSAPSSAKSSAAPIAMRWLNEGSDRPDRYALAVAVKIGDGNYSQREIVCEADGSGPKLNGKAYDESDAKKLCDTLAKAGSEASRLVSGLSSSMANK